MAKAGIKNKQKNAANLETLSIIAKYFANSLRTRQSKHIRVRHAILDAIVEGHLKNGDQIPPEQELSAALSVSLGTVQRALRELSIDGTLLRMHGRGTFVAEPALPKDEIWQFRFRKPNDEKHLPVSSVVIEESTVQGPGRWLDTLGYDPQGYLKIVRIVSVLGELDCYNELYFCITRFGALRDIAVAQLRNVNIKTILARQFNAPTLSITQHVRAAPIPLAAQAPLGLPEGTIGMDVDVVGHSYGKENIFMQRIWFPASDCYMDVTHEETISITAGGAPVKNARFTGAHLVRNG
jgi:GntR family transcriptional regulator